MLSFFTCVMLVTGIVQIIILCVVLKKNIEWWIYTDESGTVLKFFNASLNEFVGHIPLMTLAAFF